LTAPLELDMRVSHAQAVQRIIDESGQQFDPVIVEAFVLHQDSFDWVRQSLQEPVPPPTAYAPGLPADTATTSG
jgi:response regulator RpfG family c-di-GMP phosphodiesterase